MNTDILSYTRHWLLVLTIAACLAVAANFGQTALSHLTGIELTSTVYACEANSGGC
jgi:hypothetical protein